MSLPAQKLREIVLNILFSQGFSSEISEEMILLLMIRFKSTKKNIYQAIEKAKEISKQHSVLDSYIAKHCKEYALDRVTKLEKAALHIGLFELLLEKKEPPKVCINEAIRITKKFGSMESAKFVNAVLDEAYKNESNS